MKKLIVLAALLFSSPVFAQETHRPFRYETACGIEKVLYALVISFPIALH
jgi:hypothetical protein